jgi:hypothetical protein
MARRQRRSDVRREPRCSSRPDRHDQKDARTGSDTIRPRWPMIVLRTPKGWTGRRRWTVSPSRHLARTPGAARRCPRESRAPTSSRSGCRFRGQLFGKQGETRRELAALARRSPHDASPQTAASSSASSRYRTTASTQSRCRSRQRPPRPPAYSGSSRRRGEEPTNVPPLQTKRTASNRLDTSSRSPAAPGTRKPPRPTGPEPGRSRDEVLSGTSARSGWRAIC